MRRLAWLFLIYFGLVIGSVVGQGLEKEFGRTIDFEAGQRLSLKTYKGSLHLTAWEKNQIEIRAVIEAPREVSTEYGEAIVEATNVEVRERRSGLVIRSDYDDVPSDRGWWMGSWKTLPYVHYEIRAPRTIELSIDDHKSKIELYGFDGNLRVESHKGTIDGEDLSGELQIETHKGVVHLAGVRGGLDLDTHKGEMSIQADSIESDSRLSTYKGTIDIFLREAQGMNIRADLSKKADFRSDFDMNLGPRDRRNRYKFQSTVNGGGPEIRVSSYKGDIRLRRQ